MKKMFRAAAAALCLLMPLSLAAAAADQAPDGSHSVYTVTDVDGQFTQQQMDNGGAFAFWEAPALLGGQSHDPGQIVFENKTAWKVRMTLTGIGLPYSDGDALAYLDACNIVLSTGDGVIYSGPYTRINDPDLFPNLVCEVDANSTAAVDVSMSCAFTYQDSKPAFGNIPWTFSLELVSDSSATTGTAPQNFFEKLNISQQNLELIAVSVGGGILIAVLIIVMVKRGRREK